MIVPLYDPKAAPIKGLFSRPHAGSLNAGELAQIQNMRHGDDGVLTVRLGSIAMSAAIATGTVRSCAAFLFNGVPTVFCAIKNAGVTSVFKSLDTINWTELTASSGQYGITRLASDGSGNDYEPAFAVVHDKWSGKDVLVIQNGYDSPVVYDGTFAVNHEEVPLPAIGGMKTYQSWTSLFPIGTDAGVTYTNSGANFTGANSGAAPDRVARIAWTATAATNDTVDLQTFTTAKAIDTAKELQFTFDYGATVGNISQFVDSVKIQAKGSDGFYYTLYDPSSAAFARPAQGSYAGVNWMALGYKVPQSGWMAALVTVAEWRLTWIDPLSPSAVGTLDLLSISGSYSEAPGAIEHQVAYYNSGSRAESQAVTLPIELASATAGIGTKRAAGVKIPNSSSFYYSLKVYYRNPINTQRDKGVDTLRIYRKETGETDYFYAASFAINTYTAGAWTYASGSSGSLVTDASLTDSAASFDRLYWLKSPGELNEQIPIGRCMISANDRLIVGAKAVSAAGTAYDQFPRIMVSRTDQPFRFSEVATPDDPESAGESKLPNGEGAQAFVSVPGIGLQTSTVYCFTESSVHIVTTQALLSGLFLQRVASTGTVSPLTVVEHMGTVYFVDATLRVRRMRGGSLDVISWPVDDKLQGVPAANRRSMVGCWFNDRYYLSYTPSGGSGNTRILLWSEAAQTWESDDLLPGTLQADALVRWVGPASGTYAGAQDARLLFFSSTTRICYRLEFGAGDVGGSTVAIAITTGDYYAEGFTFIRAGVLADAAAGTSLNLAATYKPQNSGASTTLSLASANAYQYAWSGKFINVGTVNSDGPAGSLSITGSVAGGKRIFALRAEIEARRDAAVTA